MKKHWLSAALLTIVCLALLNGGYTAFVWGMAQLTPQHGLAERIQKSDGSVYYTNVAQKFSEDRYFWSRPSAVGYNAAGSGGSNKGPSNPDYLASVQANIDSFIAHNPSISKADIPSDMITASGSGLDPNISVQAARIQVARIAITRSIAVQKVEQLVAQNTDVASMGMGPERINVLKLNLALDALK